VICWVCGSEIFQQFSILKSEHELRTDGAGGRLGSHFENEPELSFEIYGANDPRAAYELQEAKIAAIADE